MRRLIAASLCLFLLCAALSVMVSADEAFENLLYEKDGTLNAEFRRFGNITVKSGAHVVVKGGFEIFGAVVVEPGASFTGTVQAGQFTFSLRNIASMQGVDLFFPQRQDDGSICIVPIPLDESGTFTVSEYPDMQEFSFKWNTEVKGWCLTYPVNGNPFGGVVYHNERDLEWAKADADRLNHLGLFRGTGTDANGQPKYDLRRPATRVEALVMLIRLLGKEETALNGTWKHPFTDVPAWADSYVGYAYEAGLTNGVSATTFGTGNATCQQYMTFLLRSLGYTDADTGSTLYDEAMDYADRAGLLTEIRNDMEEYPICQRDFWRADAVVASARALEAATKDGLPLYRKLIADGAFTQDQWNRK